MATIAITSKDVKTASATMTRRRQRHPDLQSELAMPASLAQCIRDATTELDRITETAAAASVADERNVKAMRATCKALHSFLHVRTPELQLRALSTVSGSLREAPLGNPEAPQRASSAVAVFLSPAEQTFMDTLMYKIVFVLLLDCRVRYVHRALTTLLRTTYTLTEAGTQEFRSLFLHTLASGPHGADQAASSSSSPSVGASSRIYCGPDGGVESVASCKDRVMLFLNSIDGLSSTVMPMMPTVFQDTFLDVLPLLCDCLCWVVDNATVHRQRMLAATVSFSSAAAGGTSAKGHKRGDGAEDNEEEETTITVFGEDLEHIRFCVRVVATYIHKYMDEVVRVWGSEASADMAAAEVLTASVARLLCPTFTMLISSAFPKDVLNAAGLLVASLLTIRSCDRWLLGVVCDSICAMDPATQAPSALSASSKPLAVLAHGAVQVMCVAEPHKQAAQLAESVTMLNELFGFVTPNGRFALLKGLLAHFSTPVHGDARTLGVLLTPLAPSATIPVYDIIMPAAERYTAAIQEPETRFMAIQTVDAIVRHIGSVLRHVASTCEAQKDMLQGDGRVEIPEYCLPSQKLRDTLNSATQLVMALWDDGTQQVSGTLYGTYNEILGVNEALKRCHALASGEGKTDSFVGLIDVSETLTSILSVRNKRRGKYHALLGVLTVSPLDQFLSILQTYYRAKSRAAGLQCFSHMLLSGASSHKVGSVAGDVFAKVAGLVRALQLPHPLRDGKTAVVCPTIEAGEAEAILREGVMEPLGKAIAFRDYVPVNSSVTEAAALSYIISQFVSPFIKQDRSFLAAIIEAVRAHMDAAPSCHARVGQGLVEVLFRARNNGVDISAYLDPANSWVFGLVRENMQALRYDLRNTSFGLCVLRPRKLELVTPWQCSVVEDYLSLNMHLGGDSTARKGLIEAFRKWVSRLTESYGSNSFATTTKEGEGDGNRTVKGNAAATAGQDQQGRKSKKEKKSTGDESASSPCASEGEYKQIVLEHCMRLVNTFVTHIGTSAAARDGLSVERRVAAMTCYTTLLKSSLHTRLSASSETTCGKNDVASIFFSPVVVPALLAELSDGWSQARAGARDLLRLFSENCPDEAIFGGSEMGKAALAEVATAHTFRNAEGAAQRYVLYLLASAPSVSVVKADPHAEVARRLAAMETQRAHVLERCAKIESLSGAAVFSYIRIHPMHGQLSLCVSLLVSVAEVPGHDAEARLGASNDVLACCCRVLSVCSRLVGGEAMKGSSGTEVVDCRGHVYDNTSSSAESETLMRAVVNNTWLSLRVATAAIRRMVELNPVDNLQQSTVREVCYDLIHALLITKHNGVMRCVRDALRAVNEGLVRSRQPSFHSLPAEMLEYLLGSEGVTSGDLSRMLRRSQGLPHALLAVLESEDASVPLALFPTAMKRLLAIAHGTAEAAGDAEVRRSQRSNALNVMKFIFETKVLADAAVAYIEDAFSTATEGFSDASWYIRNSSLMLFSSVLQRFVGEHPSSSGGSGVNTTLHDIAKRTPRAFAFAYRVLVRDAAATVVGVNSSDGEDADLALFPILQMLSMLSPDPAHLVTRSAWELTDDSEIMIGAVRACSRSRNLMVRASSAVALTCLVPATSLSQEFRGVGETIRSTWSLPAGGCSGGAGRMNTVHGMVLRLMRFHACYTGSLRRFSRCGGGASTMVTSSPLARQVSRGIASVVLACAAELQEASILCPTIAADVFALSADLVYFFEDAEDEEDENGDGDAQSPLEPLARYVASLLYTVLIEAPQDGQGGATVALARKLTDRGAVVENASLALLTLVMRLSAPSALGTNLRENCAAPLAAVLAMSIQSLHIAAGCHNIFSWLLNHICYYHSQNVSARCTFSDEAVCLALGTLRNVFHMDAATVSLMALDAMLFSTSSLSASGAAVTGDIDQLNCIAWADLVSHLEFTVTVQRLAGFNDVSNVSSGSVSPIDGEKYEACAERVERVLLQALASSDNSNISSSVDKNDDGGRHTHSVSEEDACGFLRNAEARSAAILFTSYRSKQRSTTSVDTALVDILSHYADADESVLTRHAVVRALDTLLCSSGSVSHFSSAAENATVQSAAPSSLLLILLRLLFDDTAEIRDAACVVCSHALCGGPSAAPRDQMSSVMLLIVALRARKTVDVVTAATEADCNRYLLALKNDVASATDDAEANDEDEEEGEDDGDDVLFQKESANMFIEEGMLAYVVSRIMREPIETAPVFATFDRIMESAAGSSLVGFPNIAVPTD